ncbi:MAG TPA: cation-translocating P-type ATPase [Thermoanaerobaculia bacterium]|nr:cation-translocating P-type ATPase [Thermoanaerobaculia bacterium]
MSDWYRLDVPTVLERLGTDASRGLSAEEAAKRLQERGPNELQAAAHISPWSVLADQFKNVLVVVLIAAVAMSAILGHMVEAIVIGAILLLSVLLGFIQEYRAERAIEALREMAAPTAKVLRDGNQKEIPARELVAGDLLFLGPGDRVPADSRVVEAVNLQLEEAALTGESLPVSKVAAALEGDLGIGDRRNMVFAGTAVTYGRGRAVAVETGMDTELGQVAQMVASVESGPTPLQRNLDRVGRVLALAGGVVVAVVVGLGLARGQSFFEILLFGIALAVAVVPEALPAVVTISLALGVRRMVKRHALIRRLPAVETLGSVSVICSDKTGTLTKDEMTVRRIWVDGKTYEVTGAGYAPEGEIRPEPGRGVLWLLEAAALASDARLVHSEQSGETWEVKGDPTEGALIVAAAKAGLKKEDLEGRMPRVDEIPFTSESKRMTTIHQTEKGTLAFSKGAPEVLLASCTRRLTDEGDVPLDQAGRERVLEVARELASEALRVLAVAGRRHATHDNAEGELVLLGLVGMIDPPRPEAKEAIRTAESAGIRSVMITGDHPETAQAIARELGILKEGRTVAGAELEAMSDEELEREVGRIEVYARVSPAHKLRVVTAFQAQGHSVAMTGDGVNDAPALKKADIGIAMGITGTDVTKEASAMTLTDDNFASIVAAVEEGREVFENIKKYLMFLLSSNVGEIGLMTAAALAGLPMPLSAVQILYVNLATDGLPALALAVDPPEPDLMKRPPRNPNTGIFTRPVVILMMIGGIWSALVNLGLFTWALRSGRSLEEAMAMTFLSLVGIQFVKAYNYRSDHLSAFTAPFSNRWLNLAIVWELGLLALIVGVPFLRNIFLGGFLLPAFDLALVAGVSLTALPVIELGKWMVRRGWFGQDRPVDRPTAPSRS